MYRKIALTTLAAGLLFVAPGICKCAHRTIYIEGSVVGAVTYGLSVKVEVTPDPNWEPQPTISIKDAKFSGKVYFDATKSEGRVRDDCTRIPDRVEVVLLKNDHE